jgi:hypothetical protein
MVIPLATLKECAFCPATAKLSAEHLWSDWMRALFKSKGFRFRQRDEDGNVVNEWRSPRIDLTAKVVCKPCNEGWMSNLEQRHAKPSMSDLIVGREVANISQSRANSIALFAFKSVIVIDRMRRDKPFFRRSVRHDFARRLTIPDGIQMWLAGFLPMGSGRLNTHYGDASIPSGGRLKLYACTYGVGHFIFQVVAVRSTRIPSFSPQASFEYSSIPFWPAIPEGISWPPTECLRTRTDFEKFSERWDTIRLH